LITAANIKSNPTMEHYHQATEHDVFDFKLIVGVTGIEFDKNKEKKNIEKHGYSFDDAANALNNVLFLCTPMVSRDPIICNGEIRQAHMMEYRGNIVHISTTMRKNESVRIISMRRANQKERVILESIS